MTLPCTFTIPLVRDRLFQGIWSGGGASGYIMHVTVIAFEAMDPLIPPP